MITFDVGQLPEARAALLRRRRFRRRMLWSVYALLVVASCVWQTVFPAREPMQGPSGAVEEFAPVRVEVKAQGAFDATLHTLTWKHLRDERPPVVLLHGLPGRASDFAELAPLLARDGRRIIAVDALGFGKSSARVPDYSLKANAGALAALFHSERIHLVGWSNGGGTAVHFAAAHPDRVASLTLLASIGAQEMEGSGDYAFEHFKYLLSAGLFIAAPEAVPHFGLLGSRRLRHSFFRGFWDSDQRPLRGLMEGLSVPTLVYHGRHDVLIHARAAEMHAGIIPNARLVMIDANHFIPFTHAETAAEDLGAFFAEHDEAGAAAKGAVEDRAAVVARRGVWGAIDRVRAPIHRMPWWGDTTVLSKIVLVAPTLGVLVAALLSAGMDIDLVVAFVGVVGGLIWQTCVVLGLSAVLGERARKVPFLGRRIAAAASARWQTRLQDGPLREGFSGAFIAQERTAGLFAAASGGSVRRCARFLLGRLIGLVVWAAAALLTGVAGVVLVVGPLKTHGGLAGAVVGVVVVFGLIRNVPLVLIREGRRRLWRSARRARRLEFWPFWFFSIPLFFYGVSNSLRTGHLWITGCCNPGIENAGGVVGESKVSILASLGESPLIALTCALPRAALADRTRTLAAWMNSRGISWPIILKPDEGQRGFAVKRVKTAAEAAAYLDEVSSDIVAQPYIEGPHECGILWLRNIRTITSDAGQAGTPDNSGRIFSITRKTFAQLIGDGEHTLRELIERHPRFSLQAPVFLERFPLAARMLPEKGELVRLGFAGNHCQGTMFSDGADLITPQLTEAITTLALGFRGGFDYGRFDVRFTSDEALRRGEGFTILELNGLTSESTNLYDPGRSIFWAYGVLFRQWRGMIDLGVARRKAGAKPPTTRDLFAMTRRHFRERSGSGIAD